MGSYERHSDLAVKTKLEVSKELVLDHLTFKRNDTVLFTELFGPQVGLKAQWRDQGVTEAEIDLSAFRYNYTRSYGLPTGCGRLGAFCHETGEDEQRVFFNDDLGRRLVLYKNVATLPLPENYPVKNMDDWLKIKSRYQYSPERIPAHLANLAQEHTRDLLWFCLPGGFDEPRQLLGEEEVCIAVYEQPEMIHDILATIRECGLQLIDTLAERGITADVMFTHEDMAGKSGSLWGPHTINEFIQPYTLPLWEHAKERLGCRLFMQDSDGNMNAVVAATVDSGVNVMSPMEPGSGMDIVATRAAHDTGLAFIGGLDKYMITTEKKEIDRELEYKVPAMLKTGGVVFSLDHRIPKGSPVENYRYYIKRFWEIADDCMK